MSERSEESIIAAEYVHQLAATEYLLADASLAAIDPLISRFMVTETFDEDFGRISEPVLAEGSAYYTEKVRRGLFEQAARRLHFMEHGGFKDPQVTPESLIDEAVEKADKESDEFVAQTFYDIAVAQDYSTAGAEKVAYDVRILQGDVDAMNTRTCDLMADVRAQKRGVFVALRAALALQRPMKRAQKEFQKVIN